MNESLSKKRSLLLPVQQRLPRSLPDMKAREAQRKARREEHMPSFAFLSDAKSELLEILISEKMGYLGLLDRNASCLLSHVVTFIP